MAASTSEQPNLLQQMLNSSRQERAKSEELNSVSEVDERIEAARQELIAQARAEMASMMSQAEIHHRNVVSEKDAQIAALIRMNQALSSENTNLKAWAADADVQRFQVAVKEGENITLREHVRDLEEKLKTTKEELSMKKYDLQCSQNTAKENFAAIIREREKRHEAQIWLATVNCQLEKERNALRDELSKRDSAENRRIIKERAKIRASPKNPRRFSQASPIIPQTPLRSPSPPLSPSPSPSPSQTPTNVRSGAGTIVRSRETPKKVNANSPKTISKAERRRQVAIEGVKGREGAVFLKTLAVTSAVGLVGWAKEGGYF